MEFPEYVGHGFPRVVVWSLPIVLCTVEMLGDISCTSYSEIRGGKKDDNDIYISVYKNMIYDK